MVNKELPDIKEMDNLGLVQELCSYLKNHPSEEELMWAMGMSPVDIRITALSAEILRRMWRVDILETGRPEKLVLLQKPREVIIRGQVNTGKVCPPLCDYCWECGHIDKAEAFLRNNRCPNPGCPNPGNWED